MVVACRHCMLQLQLVFLYYHVCMHVRSTDSKQEVMTVHNMQRMMEKLKTTMKTDLKEVRR